MSEDGSEIRNPAFEDSEDNLPMSEDGRMKSGILPLKTVKTTCQQENLLQLLLREQIPLQPPNK